jgi:hypothetical protein
LKFILINRKPKANTPAKTSQPSPGLANERNTVLQNNNFEEPLADAFKNIKQYMQDHSAWLYIDGQPKKIEELKEGKSVTIIDLILGG